MRVMRHVDGATRQARCCSRDDDVDAMLGDDDDDDVDADQ